MAVIDVKVWDGSGWHSIAGTSGPQGPAGASGLSAYELACARGFEGTESAWLESLIGETGPIGPSGNDGKDGNRGEIGPQGQAGEPSFYGRCLDVVTAAVEHEVSIVRHHASHAANFTQWYETWYPNWQSTFSDNLARLGAPSSLAGEHCEESKKQLLLLTETTTIDALPKDIRYLTAGWYERATVLARTIAANADDNRRFEPGPIASPQPIEVFITNNMPAPAPSNVTIEKTQIDVHNNMPPPPEFDIESKKDPKTGVTTHKRIPKDKN